MYDHNNNDYRCAVNSYDVAIIGGGPAGQQAALTLARSCRSVVLFDVGQPRNAAAGQVRALWAQDDPTAGELAERGRRQLLDFGVDYRDGCGVAEASRDGDGFTLLDGHGSRHRVRSVVLAQGVVDELPQIDGIGESWGADVQTCPYCHGWEVRDSPVAVVGLRGWPERLTHLASTIWGWTRDIVILTDGDALDSAAQKVLSSLDIAWLTTPIAAFDCDNRRLVGIRLEDGDRVLRPAAFVVSRARLVDDLAVQLGCDLTEPSPFSAGHLLADRYGVTSVPGVFGTGNQVDPTLQVIGSAGHASQVAAACNLYLRQQDMRAVVASASTRTDRDDQLRVARQA